MMVFGVYLFIVLFTSQAEGKVSWSYSGPTGPSNWGKIPGASACLGRKQSPININTFETGQENFAPFVLQGYGANLAGGPIRMENTGTTLSVTLAGNFFISGGGLPNKYKATEFHLHWGSDNSKGSEHTKDGNAYPAEMHIIHYNTLYRNIGEAISKPNGLAELGFWFKLGRHNAAWDPIINNLQAVKYANNPHIFTTRIPLNTLIPSDLSRFYRYAGSLTTPGCYETVTWTVFENEIPISRAQIAKLRQLSKFQTPPYGPGAGPELHRRLTNNFRPVQRLWFRTVYQSWPHDEYLYYNGGEGTRPGWNPKFKGTFSGHPPAGNPAGGAGAAAGAGPGAAAGAWPGAAAGAWPEAAAGAGPGAAAGAGPGAAAGAWPGAAAGPARLEDEHYLDGDTGDAQTGMQRLWYALRNGEYGEEDDFDYYEGDYGNANQNNAVSLYDPYLSPGK
ncbi:carbonic anhydrase 1-like [Amphiura filiformis]|uniref:carbonic anhydrase 1-like n=1 Tax=Amphiura filiformis TaxID=82378 RepID=UPI003B228CCD